MRLSQKSFQLFKRDVLVYGGQIVTEALIARSLGPAVMGVWLILQMIPNYATLIGRTHADEASVYFLGRDKYRLGEVSFALLLIAVGSAVVTVGVFLWQWHWLFTTFLRQAVGVKDLAFLMLGLVPLRFVTLNYSYLLISREDVAGYNAVNVLMTLVPPVLGAVLVLACHLGVAGLILSLFVGGGAALAYGAVRIHSREPMSLQLSTPIVADLLSFGMKVYLTAIASYLYLYISGLFVVLHLAASQVAFFRLSQDRALLLARIPAAVSPLLYRRVARLSGDGAEACALATVSFRLALLVLMVVGAVSVTIVKPLVFLLYGPAFAGMVVPLLVFIPGVIGEASSALLMTHYVGRGRLWLTFGMAVSALLIQLGLLWFCLPRWGLAGAVGAATAAYVITMAIRVAVFSRLEGVPLRELVPPRRDDVAFLWDFVASRLRLAWQPIASALHAR